MNGKIFIPKPCHENWNKMTPEEQGRHCAVCSKVVQDYSNMNTHEIIDSLKKSEGEVCGRINVKQVTPVNRKQKIAFMLNSWFYRRAVYPIMALLGITFVSKKALAQVDANEYQLKGKVAYQDYHTNSHKVVVIVKNQAGEIIPNSIVRILNVNNPQNAPYKTDNEGQVSFTVKGNQISGHELELEIEANGYSYKHMKIRLNKPVHKIEVRMEEEIFIMGEMAYVEPVNEQVIENTPLVDEKIEMVQCEFELIKNLPEIPSEIIDIMEANHMVNNDNNGHTNVTFNSGKFSVYPIPSNDKVNIVNSSDEKFNLDIFDANGKKIHSLVNASNRYSLDVTNYAAGLYYVVITVNGWVIETRKMIVTK